MPASSKVSSGAWTLNLDSAPCARCGCRRDDHRVKDGGTHRFDCVTCGTCPEFVIGGLPDYSGIADTDVD